jgi:hypothetical protein
MYSESSYLWSQHYCLSLFHFDHAVLSILSYDFSSRLIIFGVYTLILVYFDYI